MIPEPLATEYCVATMQDIRSWSFGELTSPRREAGTHQDNVVGTLHDQRIFGSIVDFRCACGKYAGEQYRNMICDRCGVKLAPASIRGSRFAHIELPAPIAHPLAPDIRLGCFPVLPILLIESPGGRRLLDLYDRLIDAARRQAAGTIQETVTEIYEQLTPVAITAHNWRLPGAGQLARGLALKRKAAEGETAEYCDGCGYLLAGLPVHECPGCGRRIT